MTIFSPDQVCPPVPPAGVRVPALPPLLQLRGGGGRGQGLPRQDLSPFLAASPHLERHQVRSTALLWKKPLEANFDGALLKY